MDLVVLLGLTGLATVVAFVAGAALMGRARRAGGASSAEIVHAAVQQAVVAAQAQAGAERDRAVRAALEHATVLQREALRAERLAGSAELGTKKDAIDAHLGELRGELARVEGLLHQLGRASSASAGEVKAALAAHAETTAALASTTQGLREALASPKARGQWGERMAEDVLRLAGFVEHVNYVKQTAVAGGRGVPDFTFQLPKGHVLYMDVKFPLAAYLRYLDAGTEGERSAHRAAFLRDVRLRVRELAEREYAAPGEGSVPAVDYVLLFLPNETISAFVYEQDPTLLDDALQQRVVLCSPLTLFALLGVIRQAFDNSVVEQTSGEILAVLGRFAQQWDKFTGALETLDRRLDAARRAFDDVNGPRRRQLERPLARLEALRAERNLALDPLLRDDPVEPPEGQVLALGERGA
jgi:DNA recombination protein RmuC